MKKNIKSILVIAILVICGNSTFAENTECKGTSTVAAPGQGSFTLGYNYTFTTNNNGDVTFICELLDTKSGVNAYAWTYNPSFSEISMQLVSGQKYSKTFTGQLNGATFKVACKFAYAGGMAVTQTFTYTVGSNCGIIPGAPTLTVTAPATSLTSISAISGGTITVAGTSSVTARGICWSTETKPTVELSTKTTDGAGIGTFTSNITGLIPGLKYYVRAYATNTAGTNYGPEISFTAPDTEIPTLFTATSGTPLSTSIPLFLNATDNSGSVTYTISYGTTPTIVKVSGTSGTETSYLIEGLSPGTDYSFSIIAKDLTGNPAANSPIIVAATTRPGVTSAPIPVIDRNGVISIFSDTYNSIGGTLFNPLGAQNTMVSMIQVSNNPTLKYSYFDYAETELGDELDITKLGMTNLHFDAWSEDETLLKISLINRDPYSENVYTVPIFLKETWNTYDILLREFKNHSEFTSNSIFLLKIEGSGSSGSGLKTVYIDNLFFWGSPTALHFIPEEIGINCYPNPVKDKITIKAKSKINQIVVQNLFGQTIGTTVVNDFEKSIDFNALPSGNYFITIKLSDGQSTTRKIIKM